MILACFALSMAFAADDIAVGSKAFTESYIVAEMIAQTIESPQQPVIRRFGMGGTGILFEALKNGEIDLYPEYTGTIAEAILKNPALKKPSEIERALEARGLVISKSLGFNNTYALAVPAEYANTHGLKKLSDLSRIQARLQAAFSPEFMTRSDGYQGLKQQYDLELGSIRLMEHSLAYEAISHRVVNIIDVYTTDAKIEKLGLVVLEDDRHFFPEYQAVLLTTRDFVRHHPDLWERLKVKLENTLRERQMRILNAESDLKKRNFSAIVREVRGEVALESTTDAVSSRVLRRTREHLVLVGLALLFSVLVGVPLGLVAASKKNFGQIILLMSGMIQTIPSLALLCFLIPVFGIGVKPALVALCLYGLLPVVLNTFVGVRSIDSHLTETAQALGLTSWQKLTLIEIPLASRSILAGIKTSAIISIGTATLAALIGAGGYGVPIVTGLAINDTSTILIGAIPAAAMALLTHLVFLGLERILIPRGLR